MTALDARPEVHSLAEEPLPCGPLDGLVADAQEVAAAMAAMPHESTVRIPAQAVSLVSGLGSYGD